MTKAASAITQTTATLNATVNPNGGEVSKCEFEYGETNAYGKTASCATLPGNGSSPVAVSAAITGLTANTTYHFRISATNAGGTSKGADETFKTLQSCTAEGFCASITHTESSEFGEPNAVAVDPAATSWAAGGHDQVLEFNSKHEYVRQFGKEGSGEGQFKGIGGIATDASGDVYVTDYANNRVEEFSPTGTFLRQFGSQGLGAGQFYGPTAIALDSGGNVWVVNTHGVLVQEFSATGTYMSGFGSSGLAFGGRQRPCDLGREPVRLRTARRQGAGVLDHGHIARNFDERGSGNGHSQIPGGIATDPTTRQPVRHRTRHRPRAGVQLRSGHFIASLRLAGLRSRAVL